MATGNGRRPRGFTYIGLLIAIAIMGIGLAALGPVAHTLQLRDKERELLFVGDQFRRAITSYYDRSPGPVKLFPRKLDDLLQDTRYPDVQRHLRKIYVDPITGTKEWGLVEIPGLGVSGVYSLSNDAPLKTSGFPAAYRQFENRTRYSDWKFVYGPSMATPPNPGSRSTPTPASPSTPAPFALPPR